MFDLDLEENIVYDLKKLPAYTLAKAIRYKFTEDVDEYSRNLILKFKKPIRNSIAERFGIQKTKPNRFTKRGYKKQVETFTKVLEASAQKLVHRVIKKGWKENAKIRFTKPEKDSYFIDGSMQIHKLTEGEKQINNSLFNYLMQKEIQRLSKDEHMIKVCFDYDLVQEVKQDYSRFNELEKLCAPIIKNWINNYHIRKLDPEDQYQEGLLVVWHCAEKYKAKNFARFSSFVKKGLRNKFINLLRYSIADVRRLNRISENFVPGSESSIIGAKINRLTYESWAFMQRQKISEEDNPFATLSLEDYVNFRPNPDSKLETEIQGTTCDYYTYPYLDEDIVDLMETYKYEGEKCKGRLDDAYTYEEL